MLMPIFKECLDIKHIIEIASVSWPKQDSNMPVKKYFESFKKCCIMTGITLDTEIARDLFVHGLNTENEEEYVMAPIVPPSRPVDKNYIIDLVCYLSAIEDFKDAILARKNKMHIG